MLGYTGYLSLRKVILKISLDLCPLYAGCNRVVGDLTIQIFLYCVYKWIILSVSFVIRNVSVN